MAGKIENPEHNLRKTSEETRKRSGEGPTDLQKDPCDHPPSHSHNNGAISRQNWRIKRDHRSYPRFAREAAHKPR